MYGGRSPGPRRHFLIKSNCAPDRTRAKMCRVFNDHTVGKWRHDIVYSFNQDKLLHLQMCFFTFYGVLKSTSNLAFSKQNMEYLLFKYSFVSYEFIMRYKRPVSLKLKTLLDNNILEDHISIYLYSFLTSY